MADDPLIHSAATECDAHFLASVRARLNARALVHESEVPLPPLALERLLNLAFAGVPASAAAAPLIGYMRHTGIDEASGDYFAMVTFEDQQQARRAGAMIFSNVTLEPAIETPTPANEESRHATA